MPSPLICFLSEFSSSWKAPNVGSRLRLLQWLNLSTIVYHTMKSAKLSNAICPHKCFIWCSAPTYISIWVMGLFTLCFAIPLCNITICYYFVFKQGPYMPILFDYSITWLMVWCLDKFLYGSVLGWVVHWLDWSSVGSVLNWVVPLLDISLVGLFLDLHNFQKCGIRQTDKQTE